MTQLLVKCKNCGVEFLAATQMNEETFEAISIGNTNESCPKCKRTFAYIKTDYYFKESYEGLSQHGMNAQDISLDPINSISTIWH
jgi:hypothetical protein